jgi:hypothetical protein
MSQIIDDIKQTFSALQQKYFLEISYVENSNQSIPVLLEKNYVVYDFNTLENDFTADIKKATCFDFTLGTLILSQLKKMVLGDPNIQVSLVSIDDAIFIDKISGHIDTAFNKALTAEQKVQLKIAESAAKDLENKISRLQGLFSVKALIYPQNNNNEPQIKLNQPLIEIRLADIESKTKLFTLKSDEETLPFLIQNASGKTFYKNIPVELIIDPLLKK